MDKVSALENGYMVLDHLRTRLSDFVQHRIKRLEAASQQPDELLQSIQQAKNEWRNFYLLLDEVSDPRVLEHVIHQILASEKRYNYLLQLAKEEALHNYEIDLR